MTRKSIKSRIKTRLRIIFDSFRKLDFETVCNPSEFGYDKNVVHRSSPSGDKYFIEVLNDMNISNISAFIDIGCGKGSALRAALKYPFSKIDGIEIVPEISEVAKQNFQVLKDKRVTIFNLDATFFNQYNKYDIFYFYNPFPENILERVLINIFESNQNNSKNIKIIYNNPVSKDLLNKYLTLKKIYNNEYGNGIYLYERG